MELDLRQSLPRVKRQWLRLEIGVGTLGKEGGGRTRCVPLSKRREPRKQANSQRSVYRNVSTTTAGVFELEKLSVSSWKRKDDLEPSPPTQPLPSPPLSSPLLILKRSETHNLQLNPLAIELNRPDLQKEAMEGVSEGRTTGTGSEVGPRTLKSIPMVVMNDGVQASSQNRSRRHDLPTPAENRSKKAK